MNKKIIGTDVDITIQDFMHDYGIDVIENRAIPSLTDGLKPVARRILYSMYQNNIKSTSPHKKVMTVVGDVIGKYHPHGDAGVETALVNLGAEHKTLCLPIDGHGNFGSVDTEAAAGRYIECRLSKYAEQAILKDLSKSTVQHVPNYSNELEEPVVLPAVIPNILIYPNVGIALGHACGYLPHNPRDVINLCIAYVKDRTISMDKMCDMLKGPDFPNGGEIHGTQFIHKAYKTGRGKCIVRGTYETTIIDGYPTVVINSLPYGMATFKKNTSGAKDDNGKKKEFVGALVTINELITSGSINVHEVINAADKNHPVKIIIKLKKDEDPERVVKLLIAKGVLQASLKMLHNCLFNGKLLVDVNIGQIMTEFVKFRENVIHKKLTEELKDKENQIMILEGLFKVSHDLDKAISIIRKSGPKESREAVREKLMKAFDLNKDQAEYILSLQLIRLSGLEMAECRDKSNKLKERVKALVKLTRSKSNSDVDKYMIDEWTELLNTIFKDKKYDRRTKIIETYHKVHIDSTIKDEPCSIIRSSLGYVKRVSPLGDNVKGRGTKGVDVSTGADNDAIAEVLHTNTVSNVYAITSRGRIYKVLANDIPQVSNKARGILTRNLFNIKENENVVCMFTSDGIDKYDILTIITEYGIAKSIELSDVLGVNSSGKKLMDIANHDSAVAAIPAVKDSNILIASKFGQALYTSLTNIRVSGRGSGGVKTIKLADKDKVVSAVIATNDDQIIVISTNGFAKRIKISDFNTKGRTGQGVSIAPNGDDYGDIADVCVAQDVLTILTRQGKCLSVKTDDIRLCSRGSKGVKSINLSDEDTVKTIV